MADASETQNSIFQAAKAGLELTPTMGVWTFTQMLDELRNAIDVVVKRDGKQYSHRIRHFGRNYLALHGTGYTKVKGWLAIAVPMSADEIANVLRVLKRLQDEPKLLCPTKVTTGPKSSKKTKSNRRPAAEKLPVAARLVSYSVSHFNSLAALVAEAGIGPADVFDGQRMHFIDAITKLCQHFGIKVVFPESMSLGKPVTPQQLSDLGLSKKSQ